MDSIILNTPEGRIAGYYHNNGNNNSPFALVIPHHPENGGHALHQLNQTCANAFIQTGFNVFTFDFPGIGLSQGSFTGGEQVVNTTAYIFDLFASEIAISSHKWICGSSFGAWVAVQLLMRRPGIDGFIVNSLPIKKHDFSFLSPCPVAGHIIAAEKDVYNTKEEVLDFIDKVEQLSDLKLNIDFIKDADHLYTAHLITLLKTMKTGLQNNEMLLNYLKAV